MGKQKEQLLLIIYKNIVCYDRCKSDLDLVNQHTHRLHKKKIVPSCCLAKFLVFSII